MLNKNKPDFSTVLKRRKKSLPDFLSEMNIKNQEDLQNLLSSLESSNHLSNEFKNDLKKIVDALPKETLEEEKQELNNLSEDTTEELPENEEEEKPTNVSSKKRIRNKNNK